MAEDRKFAFALFDDTDDATVAKTGPAYRLLRDLGIKSTKTVWPLKSEPGYRFFAQSLLDHEYFDFIRELQADGFEIGYHGARTGDNPRSVTIRRRTHSTRRRSKTSTRETGGRASRFWNHCWPGAVNI